MIKVRLKAIGDDKNIELDSLPGELLSDAMERSIRPYVKAEVDIEKYFVALVNGKIVEKDLWKFVKINPIDHVVFAPKISGGGDDNLQLLKAAAIIAITVYTGGAAAAAYGAGTITAGLITAGASIAASMLLNSLIPPPVPPGMDLGGLGGSSMANSQMYSITSQSNAVMKFHTVPKVYGTHRMFPTVAANPYTELETDPTTGNLVQYFYAIYDFGLGPAQISNLQIGDTPIENFSQVQYRLVDLNKPVVSEGIWDDNLSTEFKFYKGDVQRDSVSVNLNRNQSDSGSPPLADYQSQRTAYPNTQNVAQEISLTFACPAGLYAFSATGAKGDRNIDLQIEFSKVGEDVWRGFNDLTYVSHFEEVGANEILSSSTSDALVSDSATSDVIPSYFSRTAPDRDASIIETYKVYVGELKGWDLWWIHSYVNKDYGILKGATQIVLPTNADLIGKYLTFKGVFWGKILSGTTYSPRAGFTKYTLDTPLSQTITFFTYRSFSGSTLTGYVPLPDGIVADYMTGTNSAVAKNVVLGRGRITRAETSATYATFKFTPIDLASYKIRVTRLQSFSSYTQTIRDDLSWVGLSTKFDKAPIVTTKRHVFLELKILATNQLNGTIQNLSGIAHSALPVYNGSTWVRQITSNPAWVFCDLLTGEVNKKAILPSRLDMTSIMEWAAFCDEVPSSTSQTFTQPRFSTNFVLDYTPTLQAILGQVGNAAQASLNIVDGKYGVLIDKLKTTPVQIFTPRNSSNFASQRTYSPKPDGLTISYVDPSANWEVRDTTAYDNGFDPVTAVNIETATSFACTNHEQAWRLGRYLIAQNRLRQEIMTIQVDFENLICTRGDYVQVTQDVMKSGGTPARVKSISGNRVVLDDALETGAFSYGFIFRSSAGQIKTNTLSIVSADTFDLDGPDLPEAGDLIIIGVVGSIAIDCIVKSIDPGSDLSATLTLIEKADAIYLAESTDTIKNYNPDISPTFDVAFKPPGEVTDLSIADSYYECNGDNLAYKVDLTWGVPTGAAYDIFEVWANNGTGFTFVDFTKKTLYTYTVDRNYLGSTFNFKIIAVSASGKKLNLVDVGSVSTIVYKKSTPPSDVAKVGTDITGEVLQISWDRISDCSCREYLIRYSPDPSFGTWEKSIPLTKADKNTSSTSVQARTGIYMIKAIDFEGNESVNAAAAVTTIPNLFGLNVISETTDFPSLPGSMDRASVDTGGLTLAHTSSGGVDTSEYYSEGYYYYYNLLDLGEIYTVRLQSRIQAEGFSLQDLMSNWDLLSNLDTMAHAGSSDWDVETQYRTTNSYNTISLWADMASITSIAEGGQDQWTEWKKFIMGDMTGRIFEFRLKLISNKAAVSPRVFDGTIRADMPDRTESFDNILVGNTGYAATYNPAFKGPGTTPNIQVSIDNIQTGDYWTYSYRTLDGFKINLFDKNGSPVSRNCDIHIKGYGRKATAVI